MEDKKLRSELWNGKIPVCFTIAPNDIKTLLPRMSYLATAAQAARNYFSQSTMSTSSDDVWFEYRGFPIKWHLPIGVWVDAISRGHDLPLRIVIHFQGFPADKIIRCSSQKILQSLFLNALKEANYIKHGNSSRTNNLSVKDTQDLYEGAFSNNCDQYWNAAQQLFCQKQTDYQKLPVRVLTNGKMQLYSANSQAVLAEKQDQAETSENPEKKQDHQEDFFQNATLGHFLRTEVGEVVDNSAQNKNFVVQGIFPPFDVPLVWLYENFAHPDNFLYIIKL